MTVQAIVLTDDELDVLGYASDKCYMEAERLVELDHSESAHTDGTARMIAEWMRWGDVLARLAGRGGDDGGAT
jgi:hypothetical protein